jgi:hypothetical protein
MASALSKRVTPCVNAGVYHARDNQADQESLIVHFTCGTQILRRKNTHFTKLVALEVP